MKQLILTLAFAAIVLGTAMSTGLAQSGAAAPCTPAGDLRFVCGLQSPEDLVLVPGTRLLIASGMTGGSGLTLIDTQSKMTRALFRANAASVQQDRGRFASCPAALDPKVAVLHGLSLRAVQGQAGRYTLYATNHGGRESIEIFQLDARGATPAVTWIGCVLMPDMLAANSVAAFNDGTIVATVLMLPGRTFPDVFAGRNTGVVYMWSPGASSFRRLNGTELPGNNGIDTSSDDREFFVAASGSKQIVAFSRADPSKPLRTAQLKEFAPDNVRFEGNRLVTAGMIDAEAACGGAPKAPEGIQCPRGWIADAVDPKTMAITEIARGPRAAPYAGTATAVTVGNELWLSSFNSDRVAYKTLAR